MFGCLFGLSFVGFYDCVLFCYFALILCLTYVSFDLDVMFVWFLFCLRLMVGL